MLKFLQASLQQYVNQEPPDVKAGFRKGRETRDQIASIHCIIEKSKGIPEKHLLLLQGYAKDFDSVDHSKLTSFYISCGASPVELNSPCFHLYKNEFIFPQF